MRNVYATLLIVVSASSPALASAGGTSHSYSGHPQVTTVSHRLDNNNGQVEGGVPAVVGSTGSGDEMFRYDPQRANDRRGLGPRIRVRGVVCRVQVTGHPDLTPLKPGRPCIG